MTKNKKAYYVCEIHNDYLHGKSGSCIKIEGIKSEECYDGFSFDIWFYPDAYNGPSYTLFEQRNNNGHVNFRLFTREDVLTFQGGGGTSINPRFEKVARGQWNHVFVSYDGEHFSVYLNGTALFDREFRPGIVLLSAPCIIGNDFNGLIRSARIYMTSNPFIYNVQKEEFYYQPSNWRGYMHAMAYNEEGMPDVLAWAGCASGELKGEGPDGFPITITACKDCRVYDVTYAYRPGGVENVGLPIQNQAVVVNTVSSKQFSIYVKLFMKEDGCS